MQEADLLTFDAQQALRRTMEKYAGSCKLFLCCTSLNKIIEPIISRCMVIRLPAPTTEQLIPILQRVSTKECLNVTEKFYKILAEKSDRNVRRAVLMLEASVAKRYIFAFLSHKVLVLIESF
jgi:replication factor C subunit 3/5